MEHSGIQWYQSQTDCMHLTLTCVDLCTLRVMGPHRWLPVFQRTISRCLRQCWRVLMTILTTEASVLQPVITVHYWLVCLMSHAAEVMSPVNVPRTFLSGYDYVNFKKKLTCDISLGLRFASRLGLGVGLIL